MAQFDPPQIRVGGLSGRVQCITHGKEIDLPNGEKGIESSRKYDVHDQFETVARELGWSPPKKGPGDQPDGTIQ
jgi:hypothetical protein